MKRIAVLAILALAGATPALAQNEIVVIGGGPIRGQAPVGANTLVVVDREAAAAAAHYTLCVNGGRENLRLTSALGHCERALNNASNQAEALDATGFVAFRMGDYIGAIGTYDEALKLNPNMASSLYMRGVAKIRRGDTINGHADVFAAKRIDPNIAREFHGYGVWLQ